MRTPWILLTLTVGCSLKSEEGLEQDLPATDQKADQPNSVAEEEANQGRTNQPAAAMASAPEPSVEDKAKLVTGVLGLRAGPADDAEAMTPPPRSIVAQESTVASKRPAPKRQSLDGVVGSVGRSSGATAYGSGGASVGLPAAPQERREITNTEGYTDHGVNPFTVVQDDALSTFSIDVDTASYTLARRKLLNNQLPAWEGVRVEEFINYFDYDYQSPRNQPFAVHMEAMPDPFRDGRHILRVGVQGKELAPEERPPVHLTFLVDVSGSMSSADKLGLAKTSLHMLTNRLQEGDTVALATYAGNVARILDPTDVSNKRVIHDAIERLSSGGSTAMSSGIDLAYDLANQSFEKGAENRVIILSDGDANVGSTSWDTMLSQIKTHANKGVTLTTVGFGMGNYQDTLMEQLADHGDGNNVYIDDQKQAERVFVENMAGNLITIARDTKIQVEFHADSVHSYRLIGYENRDIADHNFRNDRVDAGEVGSGTNVTALYEVLLKDGYSPELATVRLRWEKPGADKEATEAAFPFPSSALKERTDHASHSLRLAYTAATFAEVLRQSPHAAEFSLDALALFAGQAARPGEEDDQELIGLIETAKELMARDVARR